MKRHRILITGSRNWDDWDVLRDALEAARSEFGNDAILVHGDCPTGADRMASYLWGEVWGLGYEDHPAKWSEGKSAGPRRNQEMVDLGADVCLAFPLPDSRGTKHCMGAAERAGIPVLVFEPKS